MLSVVVFDKDGNIDNLRFPPFHEEMLTQGMWQAGENMGRIKVLIAEGLFTEQPSDGKQPFERVRNVVAFSFQHAPLGMFCHANHLSRGIQILRRHRNLGELRNRLA